MNQFAAPPRWLLILMLWGWGGLSAAAEPTATPPPMDDIAERLRATFTNFEFDAIKPSEIPGLVEIYAGPRILYYAPAQEILVLGELYAANGVSLTEKKVAAFAASKAQQLDRTVALRVGKGPREIVTFVDPDCRYCRAAHEWMREQKPEGVTELIYFMPLTGRPQAESRALKALCAPESERAAALDAVFSGQPVDASTESTPCPQGREQLARHAAMARQLGVYATPFFIVDGQVIAGFDRDKLTALLVPSPPLPPKEFP
jgi:thiol:disulfide interchange protein DsbC